MNAARKRSAGFPFRIEVRCTEPVAELRGKNAQVVLRGADLVMLAQIYQPTLLIGEFKSPMTVADPGQPPAYVVNWSLGQSSVRGTPRAPQRGSLVFDNLKVQRPGSDATVLSAKRFELHGRMAEGSAADNPVLDVGLRATAASAPEVHPIAAIPLDAEVSATLRGLADFAPKPWPARFRELQARGGRIDIVNARVQQGEVIAVSSGSLGLTERGNLDGQLQMTVVGLEHVLKQLDLEAHRLAGPCRLRHRQARQAAARARRHRAQAGRARASWSGSTRSASAPRSRASPRSRCRCASSTAG